MMVPPDWRTAFVLGVAGAMYGTMAMFACLGWTPWEWNAVAAIAATGAAVVALIPIYEGWTRSRKKVATMRSRLMAALLLVQTLAGAGMDIDDPVVQQAGDEVEEIFKFSELLEADEIDPLFSFVVTYRILRAHGTIRGNTHFQDVLLAASKAMRKRAPKPPVI